MSCEDSASKKGAIINFVPENASVVLKFSEAPDSQTGFNAFDGFLKNNTFLSAFLKKPPFSVLLEKGSLLKHLNPKTTSLLCFNQENDSTAVFTYITRISSNLLLTDSIPNIIVDTIMYRKNRIRRISLDSQIIYTVSKDSVFIASSSQNTLEAIMDDKTEQNKDFKKLFSIQNTSDFTAIIRDKTFNVSDSLSINFTSWTDLNILVAGGGISATGVALARDTIPQLLSVFEGQVPQQNDLASIVPTSALGAKSFTFNDAEGLQLNLKKLRGDTNFKSQTDLFGTVNEVGEIFLLDGKAIFIKSIDPLLTQDALARYITKKDQFREVTISSFSESGIFVRAFTPLIYDVNPILFFQLDDFFVFSETEEIAQQIITAYLNKDCLSNTSYFNNHQSQLSSASTLLFFRMQGEIPTSISGFLGLGKTEKQHFVSLNKFPLAALQYSYDRDFAHVNFISYEASVKKQGTGGISQDFSLILSHELLGEPQFFSNHNTNQKNIVVQDVTNTLHLISSGGKELWKKKLDGPILGKITEVDILRNGKKQMAFTTQNSFYVIDRNGKDVAPFSIKFKDPITQPLAVFDYENNRKYRFVITQGEEIFLYDSKGKIVRGFNFKKAASTIALPPQHLQVGNKDYIAIAEENGKLNLLSRRGESRINVAKKFKFSRIPIAKEGTNFVVITADNKKESISQSGKVSSQSLDVSSNYYFGIKGNTKVTLDDNLLRINGKLVELPFGVYTKPSLFFANKTIYVSITETQESKVYVYDTTGSLLRGFPVFGTSIAEIADASKKGELNITVKGGVGEVILYQIK